ncbi:hypothetical protein [Mycobacterium ulcerans]
MIFGAALLGPECRHGLSGERSSWLLFVVGDIRPCGDSLLRQPPLLVHRGERHCDT